MSSALPAATRSSYKIKMCKNLQKKIMWENKLLMPSVILIQKLPDAPSIKNDSQQHATCNRNKVADLSI